SPIKKENTNKKTNKKTSPENIGLAINITMLICCGIFAFAFVSVYTIVSLSETKLSNLHSKISELNYENIELENKLENVKSYYSVDTKVSSTADFDKAKNVLEVNHVNAKTVEHNEPQTNNLSTVTGF
ncbi:MAG: hypothetical protein MJ180_03925, partial [Candidatus Gastranaerophilales bacterium]|nr:hypothetical protein [Candidatus Gastranaerophilales bacterium]